MKAKNELSAATNPKIRTRFDRKRVTQDFVKGSSKTKQQFVAECDINNIIKRYQKDGIVPTPRSGAHYADYSTGLDYQEALNTVIKAQEDFFSLPALIREKFYNNPAQYLDFVTNPDNIEEMCKLGLASKRKNLASEQKSLDVTVPTDSKPVST